MSIENLVVPDSFNTRKIPRVAYIKDIEAYVAQYNGDTAQAITSLDNEIQKYNFMYENFVEERNALVKSIPELISTKEALEELKQFDEIPETAFFRYELANGVFAKARIVDRSKVSLFLGSRTMVEYTMEEAIEVLENNIEDCKKQIEDLENNLEFLKEQITTLEVAISRTFNWDVEEHRKEKETIERIKAESPAAQLLEPTILESWAEEIIDKEHDSYTQPPTSLLEQEQEAMNIQVEQNNILDDEDDFGDIVTVKGTQFVICSGLVVPEQLLHDKILPLVNEELKKLGIEVDDVFNALMTE